MILYKYMSYENFEKFLDSGCIVFSSVDSFNDISEIINYFSSDLQDENIGEFEKWLNSYSNFYNSVILCLTRNPLNTLMWAHYGNSHKGVVIGIDISKTDMTIFENNILPIQLGSVIYTKTYPSSKVVSTNNIANLHTQSIGFNLENIEILQRIYLYKSIYWSYEEEVRVVKHRNYSKFKRQDFYDNHKFMELPLSSVVEVYFGASLIDKVNVKTYELLKEKYKDIVFMQCFQHFNEWSLYSKVLSENDLVVNNSDDEWVPIKISTIYLLKVKMKKNFKDILNKIYFYFSKK
jgi:Protein of unknown function (DUF2971)